jgi:hypothetical protein
MAHSHMHLSCFSHPSSASVALSFERQTKPNASVEATETWWVCNDDSVIFHDAICMTKRMPLLKENKKTLL